MTPQWHVLYTRHQWETKVAATLASKGLEYYCPLNRVEKQGRKKMVPEVLFPSWVFVKASASELPLLRQLGGIVSLVYWLGRPVVVTDNEIAAITAFVNEHQNIAMERTPVNIVSGGEATMDTSFQSMEPYNLETLFIPSLGVSLSAMVRVSQPVLIRSENEFGSGLRYAIS